METCDKSCCVCQEFYINGRYPAICLANGCIVSCDQCYPSIWNQQGRCTICREDLETEEPFRVPAYVQILEQRLESDILTKPHNQWDYTDSFEL